jgi:hypothetical protein
MEREQKEVEQLSKDLRDCISKDVSTWNSFDVVAKRLIAKGYSRSQDRRIEELEEALKILLQRCTIAFDNEDYEMQRTWKSEEFMRACLKAKEALKGENRENQD